MVILAKFKGKCRVCGCTILRGDQIEWSRAEGAAHVKCTPAGAAAAEASERSSGRAVVGPCWECGAEGGKFRAEGEFGAVGF